MPEEIVPKVKARVEEIREKAKARVQAIKRRIIGGSQYEYGAQEIKPIERIRKKIEEIRKRIIGGSKYQPSYMPSYYGTEYESEKLTIEEEKRLRGGALRLRGGV